VAEVGRYDDYFELGGDSILAVQLAARARDAGLPLTARMVFEHTVVADLAKKLDDTPAVAEAEDTSHEPMTVSGLSAEELAAFTSSWTASGDAAQ
jgi:mycobactin peptide synthetase MbtE